MIDLAQGVNALENARARQTTAWLQLLGIEEESREARDAHLRLQTSLTMRYAETAREWQQAKADVKSLSMQLDGLIH